MLEYTLLIYIIYVMYCNLLIPITCLMGIHSICFYQTLEYIYIFTMETHFYIIKVGFNGGKLL